MNFAEIIESSVWPDVPINQNKTEFEIFSNYFDAANKRRIRNLMLKDDECNCDCKNIHTANKIRNVGNQYYKNQDYKNALNCYYKSITLAPRDSVEFGLALGNRSAVLFCLEKYEECLQDINNILKTEYPKDLYYKIYLRQSQCYIKLNKIEAATQSLQMTKECRDNTKFEDPIKLSINNKITEMENQLGATLDENVPNELYDYTFLEFKLKDEENSNFLNASKMVDLKHNKVKGRYVVANADISKGDVLIKEDPYAFAVVHTCLIETINDNSQIICSFGEKDYIQTCAICLRRTLSYMPCSACSKHFYCSSSCQKSDQDHRWECEGLKLNILTVQQTICLAILSQACRDGFKTKIEDDSVYGNRMNNYPYINQLLTHKNDIAKGNLRDFIKMDSHGPLQLYILRRSMPRSRQPCHRIVVASKNRTIESRHVDTYPPPQAVATKTVTSKVATSTSPPTTDRSYDSRHIESRHVDITPHHRLPHLITTESFKTLIQLTRYNIVCTSYYLR